MHNDHSDNAGELDALWRTVRAMLIGATIGLLCFGAWWAADKTLHGINSQIERGAVEW